LEKKYQKNLRHCLREFSYWAFVTIPDAQITGIAWDSRKVQPGDVFFALVGENVDGHQFINAAVERGAAAVVGTRNDIRHPQVPYVFIEGDDRLAMAEFSAIFYDYPSRDLVVIGITGTDGKTTTTNLVYHILKTAGIPSGMISSVNAVVGTETLDTGFHVTTPESPDIQRYLAHMRDAGLTHVVLETTSHGLSQKRVVAVDYDLAAVTNVTHEHLDYHRDYPSYLQAKGKLFEMLPQTPHPQKGVEPLAVLNKDDQSYSTLKGITQSRILSYSLEKGSDLWADGIEQSPAGLRFTVHGIDEGFQITSPLIGWYNVYNSLAAIGLTRYGLNVPIEKIQKAFETLPIVPGRMEQIDMGQDFLAIVDFAHTPNAINQALQTARQLTMGKIIVVFGSAGLRDIEKRKLMPEVAAQLADEMILTAEDPRTEHLDAILADMAEGAERGGAHRDQDYWLEPDRGQAIRLAVERAKAGDLVILCGKGHEQSMCFGQIEYPWDDRTALRAALAEKLGVSGPVMPQLPTS
jgi:UDP-N-acetylmuramoyl-L-alanyl-D-glutamate--2,6-diaminopimelate ligase